MYGIEKTSVLSGNTHCMLCVRYNVCYNNNNNNNCLKSNIQCIEIRVQWTVHLSDYREDKCSIW